MRVIECEQGSAQWLKAREGKITASRMADVLNYNQPTAAQKKDGQTKGKESQKRADYRTEIIAERLTGLAADYYVSNDMKWGTEWEASARSAYELATGNFLEQVGFVLHPTLDYAGASPDGLYRTKGGAEFKCPRSTTHLEYTIAGVVPELYIPQMNMEMLCCEREWIDFVSFDPRMPQDLQLFIIRHWRNEEAIKAMEAEVVQFETEINEQIERLYGTARRRHISDDHEAVPESGLFQSLRGALDEGSTEGTKGLGGGRGEAQELQSEQGVRSL